MRWTVRPDDEERAKRSKFCKSRWFKRSWTLQELIAPRTVVFLSQDWKGLGTKDSLADLIEEITHIDRDVLTHRKALADECVAERMRWAARREATRVEDEAYSLLGIFGITMPTLYGEGEYAFQRLQEEILRRIPDCTLFAWGGCAPFPSAGTTIVPEAGSLVASSPRSFASLTGKIDVLSREDIESLKLSVEPEEYTPTPHGIRTQLFFIPVQALNPSFFIDVVPGRTRVSAADLPSWHLVLLGSQHAHNDRRLLGKLCSIPCTNSKSNNVVLHVPGARAGEYVIYINTFTISLGDLVSTQNLAQLKTVYLPHPKPSVAERRPPYEQDTTLKSTISLSTWARDALQPYGYTISDLRPIEDHPQYSSFLTLSNVSFNVHIQYRHMLAVIRDSKSPIDRRAMVIEARIWILSPDSDEDVQRDALQHNPPYTSSIWLACEPSWAVTLPLWTIRLVTQSRDEATLRLGLLGIATPAHFHTHVEVATNVANPTCQLSTRAQAVSEGLLNRVIRVREPPTDLKFTLLGSVRRALEARGYSVYLEWPGNPLNTRTACNSHSLSLIISNVDSGFTIYIKYFHMFQKNTGRFSQRFQELVVVARVTLESLVPSDASHNSKGYQDGPYVVCWLDHASRRVGWQWHQEEQTIGLIVSTGNSLTLRLGLDLAWESEYYLVVDIEHDGGSCSPTEPPDRRSPSLLSNPHSRIILTLPAHIKRALQTHGYDVHFKGSNQDPPDHYHLTLSDANLTIDIDYSYHLSTGSHGEQGLTFRACVTTLSLQSSQDAATQPARRIPVEWDAWQSDWDVQRRLLQLGGPGGGWRWNLPQKEVKLALPTDLELTLRLGFYLVWLSEYCITVEVIPPSPLQRTTSDEALVSAPTSAHSSNDGEDGAGMQETAAGEVDSQDVAHSGVVAPVALPSPGVEDAQVEGAGAGDEVE